MSDTPDITARSWIMLFALAIVWGSTFMVMELALRGITPMWLAAGRIGFAAVLAGAVWAVRGGKLFLTDARDWPALFIATSLTTAIPFMLLCWGLEYVTSGFAGISMAAVVLMVLPLAHFFVPGEKMTTRRTIGFVIGFAGILVLVGPGAFASSGEALELWGRLACLGAAACYAISSIVVRRLPPIDPVGLTAATFILGCIIVIPVALITEGLPPAADGITLFWVVLLGMLPTAAANLLRIVIIRSAGPVFMGLVNYQVPILSIILGAIVLNEPFPPSLKWALVLILAGMGLSQYGALTRLFTGAKRRSEPLPKG
ncbi:DMT family transporter [Pseudoprimorskyibacter insulae]|nr:DMT family transporter [Pseudoprimorskyibacter insulae]